MFIQAHGLQRSGLVWVLFLHTHYKQAKDGTGPTGFLPSLPKGEDVGAVGEGALKELGQFNYSDLSRHRKGKLSTHKRKLQDFNL